MARPRKTGLSYYYKDAHEWDDYRIIDLVDAFGPVGYAVYDVIRSEVYKNGYYLELPPEKLALLVIREVGNRWIEDKSFVLQVVAYCGEIGLFHPALLEKSVITSAEIQRHYAEVTARSKADKTRYWLLGQTKKEAPAASFSEPNISDETDETNEPQCHDTAETPDSEKESEISAEKSEVFSAKMQQRKAKKSKQKQSKSKQSKQKQSKQKQSKSKQSKQKQSKQKQSKPPSCRPGSSMTRAQAAAAAAATKCDNVSAQTSYHGSRETDNPFYAVTGRRLTGNDRQITVVLTDKRIRCVT